MNKNAFTLAEVLITLGIIGIVAAMTMPVLIAQHQKKETISKLKKAYSTIAQAYELSKLENGEFENWDVVPNSDAEEYFNKFWKPYLNVLKVCEDYKDCGYSLQRPWKQLDPTKYSQEDVSTKGTMRFGSILADGTVVTFRTPPVNQSAKINIDINGAKGPNRTGRDYFWLEIKKDGKLQQVDLDILEDNGTCVVNGYGDDCFAKIVRDGWEFKSDYPW